MTDAREPELKTVAEDLKFLDRAWREDVEDEEIRRTGGILGILLIDDWYRRAWRAAGNPAEPSVSAIDLLAGLSDQNLSDIAYAQAGGANSFGVEIFASYEFSRVLTPDEIVELHQKAMQAGSQGAPYERSYRLTEYLESPSLVAKGQAIPRRLVVKYVRNRLGGGGHLGLTEHKDRSVFEHLDEVVSLREIGGRPAVYFELLSIGQTIGQSDDARALREALSGLGS